MRNLESETLFHPAEIDVFEAKQALESGDKRPILQYLRDLAEVLRLSGTFIP